MRNLRINVEDDFGWSQSASFKRNLLSQVWVAPDSNPPRRTPVNLGIARFLWVVQVLVPLFWVWVCLRGLWVSEVSSDAGGGEQVVQSLFFRNIASGIFLAYIGIIYVSILKEIALSKAVFTSGSSRLIIRDYTKIQLIKTYLCFFSMGGVFGLGVTNMTFEDHYVGAALARAWGAPLGGMGLSYIIQSGNLIYGYFIDRNERKARRVADKRFDDEDEEDADNIGGTTRYTDDATSNLVS